MFKETLEIHGTNLINYHSLQEFIPALENLCEKRLFTFQKQGQIYLYMTLSFLDRNRTVHKINFEPYSKNKILLKDSINEIEGRIEISPFTGKIYQTFETSSPESDVKTINSYLEWYKAVAELPYQNTKLQYALDLPIKRKQGT